MPTLSLTLSAQAATELVDALCFNYGYRASVEGAPNPETRQQFARRIHIQILRGEVENYRARAALTAVNRTPADIT